MSNETAYRVLTALTDRPKSREQLCRELNMTDRALRREISALRDMGKPVCSSSRRGGYWLGTGSAVQILIAEYRSRAKKELAKAKALEQRELEGQQTFL